MDIISVSFVIGSIAAFLIGLSKTGVPGVGIASVVLMTYAFPGIEKQSTGAVLPLLILADVFAICYYRKDVEWKRLRTLFPPVLLGLVCGAFVLNRIDNAGFRMLLGGIIIALLCFEQLRNKMQWNGIPDSKLFAWFMGGTAGFTTQLGNAAGPVMSVYMASQDMSKERLMGTWAWFFFTVNLSKLPFMTGVVFPDLRMITLESLRFDLLLVPAVVAGSVFGKRLFTLIPEKYFVKLVLLLNVIPPIEMLLHPLIAKFFS